MAQSQDPNLLPSKTFPRLASRLPRIWGDWIPNIWGDFSADLGELVGGEQTGLTLSEDKENIHVEAAMPGLKASDIEVHLEKGILRIRGERQNEEQDKDKKFYRRASSSFSYNLMLPANIDESLEPKATYQDGIMKITFKKTKSQQGKKIKVK